MTSQIFSGTVASPGFAMAKIFILDDPQIEIQSRSVKNVNEEIDRFEKSVVKSIEELKIIKEEVKQNIGEKDAEIFSAHLLILEDPEYITAIKDKIISERINAESAVHQISKQFIDSFEQLEDNYFRERALDIRDISIRLHRNLSESEHYSIDSIKEEAILVAKDLTPSDLIQMNPEFVKGIVTDEGGRTSHTAIISRSMNIPLIVGTKNVAEHAREGEYIIIDGFKGQVILRPEEKEKAIYEKKIADLEAKKKEWALLADQASVTKDTVIIKLHANLSSVYELNSIIKNGAEGIGLYRTEFLYMEKNQLPTEEEQYIAYKTVLEKMEGKPVTIRTLDIGGDKNLPYLKLPLEDNPFLGYRAIRYSLGETSILRTQLRALLRASSFGQLKVMFPMITTLTELRQAKKLFYEEKEKLIQSGVYVSDHIDIGMMVEVPAAAIMAEQFAQEVDFFSIGTNDLIQYTMATDRLNRQVSHLYQMYHPSILKLIHMVIQAANKKKIPVEMCGEMAGDLKAIPILLGLGLKEYSMNPSSILPVRSMLRELSIQELSQHVQAVLTMGTEEEVLQFVDRFSTESPYS